MKKNFDYQGYFKKAFGLILVGIIFFSTVANVYASTLTIDSVSKQFNQSTIIQGLAQLGTTVSSKVNTTDKTMDLYSDNEKIFSFKYGNDYIEYNNRSAVVTQDNWSEDFATALWIQGLMESVFVLSGYENKTISSDVDYTNTYDTYGIQLETENYDFSSDDDESGSSNISGTFIKYFKISLDTEKIDALMSKYGVDEDEQDPNKEVINSLKPSLKADKITENSVTIYPSIPYVNTDPDYTVYCFIYRSDSEDGTYEKISEWATNCLDSVGIVDEGLKSNTTYYYKTIVDGGTIYSNPIEVTTKVGSTSTTTNNNENIKNPKTGVTYPIIAIIIVMIISIVTMFYVKKKDFFKQI